MSKCLVLFVEGDTEVEFYKRVIANARDKRPDRRFDTSIECRNVNGVGGFKNIALRKFVKEIKPKYDEDCVFTVVLCSDTDVFELSQKPPVKWDEVRKDMIQKGASKVITVKAKHSIEDWLLYDADGIVSFLALTATYLTVMPTVSLMSFHGSTFLIWSRISMQLPLCIYA